MVLAATVAVLALDTGVQVQGFKVLSAAIHNNRCYVHKCRIRGLKGVSRETRVTSIFRLGVVN